MFPFRPRFAEAWKGPLSDARRTAHCKMFPRVILFAAALCVASTSASSLSPAMALAPATAKQRTVAPLAMVLPPDSIAESAQSPLQMHSLIAAL